MSLISKAVRPLLTTGLLLWGLCLPAQVRPVITISGTVHDSTGLPIPGTTIRQPTSNRGTVTDSNGHYELTILPASLIIIEALGYNPISRSIPSAGTLNFILTPKTGQLQEVIITGASQGITISKTPLAMAVVSRKEMDMNTNSNAIDAVMKIVPGVSAVTTGPNVSKPFIRGLGYNRVLTMYDGIRQEGQQWGDEHGIEIDQYGIGKAEVIKGPASLTYGSDALAGVINMLPLKLTAPEGKLRGDIMTEHQTNNGLAALSAGLGFTKNGWEYNARISAKAAMSYHNKIDGYVYGTGFQELDAAASASLEKAWGSLKLGATFFSNKQEIPDGSRDSLTRKFTHQVLDEGDDITNRPIVPDNKLHTYTIQPLHQQIKYSRFYIRNDLNMGKGKLHTSLAWQQSIRQEYNHPTLPTQPGLDVTLYSLTYSLKYDLPQWNGIATSIGANGMYQNNKNVNGTDFPIPDYHILDLGGFLFADKHFGKLTLAGGIRYDRRHLHWDDFYVGTNPATGFDQHTSGTNNTLQFPAFTKVFTGISGSAGLTYAYNAHWVIKANLARGYRAPNITETGANGLDPGAHIVYLGNRHFKPEFSLQEDLGISGYFNDIDIMLEIFNNNLENYIYQSRLYDDNGQPVVIVPGNYTYQYQQAKAWLYGIETVINIHPSLIPWLSWNNALSYIQGMNQSESLQKEYGNAAKYLPYMPPLHLRSELKAKYSQSFVKLEWDYHSYQSHFYRADNTETYTPAYTLINAGCGTTIFKKVTLFLGIDNIFNVAYQSNMNRLKYFEYYSYSPNGHYGIYNMGRNMSIKVSVAI